MKVLPFAIAGLLLATTPAVAKDVTLTFTDQEQKVFLQMLDVALKQGGLQNLGAVAGFVKKYQDAVGPVAPAPAPEAAPAAPTPPEEGKK